MADLDDDVIALADMVPFFAVWYTRDPEDDTFNVAGRYSDVLSADEMVAVLEELLTAWKKRLLPLPESVD